MVKQINNSVIGGKSDLTKALRVEGGISSGARIRQLQNPKGPVLNSGPIYILAPTSKQKQTPKQIPGNPVPTTPKNGPGLHTRAVPRQSKTRRSSLKPYWEGVDPRKLSAGDLLRWKGVKTNLF